MAAPLSRYVFRSPGTDLAAAAAVGMPLMISADLLAQSMLVPFQAPVGLVTSAVGGAYLVAVLARRERWRQ